MIMFFCILFNLFAKWNLDLDFEREKIILHDKNLKHRKIILLINFIFDPTFFLIAS